MMNGPQCSLAVEPFDRAQGRLLERLERLERAVAVMACSCYVFVILFWREST